MDGSAVSSYRSRLYINGYPFGRSGMSLSLSSQVSVLEVTSLTLSQPYWSTCPDKGILNYHRTRYKALSLEALESLRSTHRGFAADV